MSATAETKERININDLSVAEKKALTKNTFTRTSYFQTLFQCDNMELACEKQAQAFRREIERLLIEKKLVSHNVALEALHTYLSDEMNAYNFDDGVNKISTFFYDTDEAFQAVYYQFIRHLRENYFHEPFYFQATPTLRLHSPNGKNNHHFPRYHTDVGYGHPPEEINLWLPLTALLTGHGFRIMSVAATNEVLQDYQYDFSTMITAAINDTAFTTRCNALSAPVTTELGSVFAFDSRSMHTGEPLHVHSRTSMDIRILPVSQYEKMDILYQGSGRRKIIFAPGYCYHHKNSDQI